MTHQMSELKIIFAASSGGHLEQLLMLKPLMDKYDSILVTEKTDYAAGRQPIPTVYLQQVNRKEPAMPWYLLVNSFKSLHLILKEKPDVMITTGVLAMIPMALLMKLFGKKLIYIESFAKVKSKNLTGKLLYHFADQFYVQWESMLELYPRAICKGGIY